MKATRFAIQAYPILLSALMLASWTLDAQSTAPQPSNGPAAAPKSSAKPARPRPATGDASPAPQAVAPLAPTGQNPASQSPGAQAAGSDLQTSNPLKITLTPSELPLKLGSNSNITADIQNVANRPVEIETGSIQLMTHAILSPSDSLCVTPLAGISNSIIMGQPYLVLQPQDHLSVFFNLSQRSFTSDEQTRLAADQNAFNSSQSLKTPGGQLTPIPVNSQYQADLQADYNHSCDSRDFGRIKRAFDFSPGNYNYFVSGRFSVCQGDENGTSCYYPTRSFGQSATFQVGIDQTLIIIFAIVGGMLAYFVDSVRSPDGPIGEFFSLITAGSGLKGIGMAVSKDGLILILKILRDSIGVAILSSAFTIVSSRLSDSQFPIKVSVLDVWGAITIGFLSYFVGNKFIDSLRGMVK